MKSKSLIKVVTLALCLTILSSCKSTDTSDMFASVDFEARDERAHGNVGRVRAENVRGLDKNKKGGLISIDITKDTNYSGQFRTKEEMGYGTYEANIKLPKNDGLLSGFFLYNRIDYNGDGERQNYEIDLEMFFRDGSWQAKTTIYNPTHPNLDEMHNSLDDPEPEAVFKNTIVLDFDPTEDFNKYTINFYKDYISFEINEVEISRWDEEFEFAPMYLYAGTFYTHWLNKEPYEKLGSEVRRSLRKNGILAYDYDNMLSELMNELFGRESDYQMEVKEIKKTDIHK